MTPNNTDYGGVRNGDKYMSEVFKIDLYKVSGQVNQGCTSCRITHVPSGIQAKAETKAGLNYNKLQAFSELVEKLGTELEKVKEDAREAVNTSWRFINAYEKKNDVPIYGALKSAKFHLKNVDYIFSE